MQADKPFRPFVTAINSVTEIEDVFVAKIVPGFATLSRAAYILCFSGTLSTIASMMMSQSARSLTSVVPFNRARIASGFSEIVPF